MVYGLWTKIPVNMTVWEFISKKFNDGVAVILLYVLNSEGSSPGRQGFKMAVAGDGTFNGSIGGGIMEHKFVEMAKIRLLQSRQDPLVYKQIHDKVGKNQSGMICSGEQTIFIYQVQQTDIVALNVLIDSIKNKRNGTLELSNSGIHFSNDLPYSDFHFEQAGEEFLLKEKTGFKNILHIIGGGHCALALSKFMSEMDFFIYVYDERKDLNTMDQNQYAHKKVILDSYASINAHIENGENVYVVIMTFGYRTDDIAVRALFDKKVKYFGLLGSRKKIEKMFGKYRKEKISEAALANLHAPVGIQIKSQTPVEIAISIAAEIINVKNDTGS